MHLKQAVPLPVDAGCFAALRSATRAPAASPLHWLFPPPVMLSSQTLTWLAPPADRSISATEGPLDHKHRTAQSMGPEKSDALLSNCICYRLK